MLRPQGDTFLFFFLSFFEMRNKNKMDRLIYATIRTLAGLLDDLYSTYIEED